MCCIRYLCCDDDFVYNDYYNYNNDDDYDNNDDDYDNNNDDYDDHDDMMMIMITITMRITPSPCNT